MKESCYKISIDSFFSNLRGKSTKINHNLFYIFGFFWDFAIKNK